MEKLEALEQLQSHIEGWEVCLGLTGARGMHSCRCALWSGHQIQPTVCVLFGLVSVKKKKKFSYFLVKST